MNFSDLKNDLKIYPSDKIVFVGLGNQLRQDDAAGLLLTKEIRESKFFIKAKFLFAGITPENYLKQILENNPKLVVFIDAADFGATPGTISWIEGNKIEEIAISTHTYSISLIEKYLKLSNNLDIKYLVIQPESMQFNEPATVKVEKNIHHFLEY